jgi:hypothetical protein
MSSLLAAIEVWTEARAFVPEFLERGKTLVRGPLKQLFVGAPENGHGRISLSVSKNTDPKRNRKDHCGSEQ